MMVIKKQGFLIDKYKLIYFLYCYLIGILVWDYTIIYQLALVSMVGMTALIYKNQFIQKSQYLLMSCVLTIYFCIHTIAGFSVDVSVSRTYLITMFINLIAAMAMECILSDNCTIEKIMKVWVYIAVATSLYIFYKDRTRLFSGELGTDVSKLFTGGNYSHNDIALVAAFAIVFLNYFKINKIPFKLNVPLQVYFIFFIVLTGARKSLLLAVAGIVVYPLIFTEEKKAYLKKMIKILLAFIVVVIAFRMLLTIPSLYNIIGYRFAGYFSGVAGGTFTESSAMVRNVMKETAMSLISERPITGWGLNTFRTFRGSYGTWSHINYLELWVSGGIFAVLIYYSFYIYAIVKLVKIKNSKMKGMFLTIMLFMFLMDYLSITYISRFMGVVYCMVDSFIRNESKHSKNELVENRNRGNINANTKKCY